MMETQREYYENGNLKSETPYLNNLKHGVAKSYYENGNLECEIPFDNDKRHGVEKEYDENGNLIKEALYENGELKTGGKNEQNRMD